MSMSSLLRAAVAEGASDLHLADGHPPTHRIDGALRSTDARALTGSAIETLVREIVSDRQWKIFQEKLELDFGYEEGGYRFRFNVHVERGNVAVAARLIPLAIPSFKDIGLPESVVDLARSPHGLVLVTGPSGAGKSTTLASLLADINAHDAVHILTLEDPIEFVFPNAKGLVKQREVGSDTLSFAEGLRHALRQDPDVIMVGEMRDPETIAAALTLAETGHLVFSTLHTNSAAQAVHRIVDSFAEHRQDQVRAQLALTLRGVVAQVLLPRVKGSRVAAREILMNTPACANLIRENKVEQIPTVIQTGRSEGMVSLESAITELVKAKQVREEDAVAYLPTRRRR
ncbi:hypothetical protein A2304_04885 [Candidatus Uhrbacteria bacterium RIFOXYB2_FULL_57_15]|uniref:Bacterial type II secretion system protein E domain-containing protein n=1 Tax=Candidatus Uhrbacteria bacterium RIFOXYB2_FULL_57_15 TaxID=1802422 RepID=A0A1F7W7M6_9BACT|nr:MAG: hypothetical protein A2304_04885 [Candidatus Uhrbacteria bacterium RIFOXYB2_FULL_57_15]OGL99788.1 MAG: hypothetical protein A2501_04670 [Candidatus Uhrbacteria bacterium RIFOXYC12_FULL_57_11]